MVSSSGSLEASVLVTIEASGPSTVPVPGEFPCGGARKLENGGREGVSRQRSGVRASGVQLQDPRAQTLESGIYVLESQLLCTHCEMLHSPVLSAFPFPHL